MDIPEKIHLNPGDDLHTIFEYGGSTGSAMVYITSAGKIIEQGGSGGIDLDEPIRNWNRQYESWEAWFTDFREKHGRYWFYFSPLFIDESIRLDIMVALEKEADNNETDRFHKDRWLGMLG